MKRTKLKKEKKKPEEAIKKKTPVKKTKTGQTVKSKPEQKLRVLILEDTPSDAELMERQLRRDRIVFSAQRVETEARFIEALRDFEPDLVLADFTLPRFDAMEALALARKVFPFIPFIVVTGSIGEEKAVACLRAGADDYLLKDRLTRLGEAVRQSLEKHRLQRERENMGETLLAAAARWRTTFDSMNDAVCLLDEKGTVQQCNRAMNRLLDIPYTRIIGKDCLSLVCGAAKKSTCAFRLLLKDRKRHEEETYWRERWFHVQADPIIGSSGRLIGAVHIMTDISRQKKSEQALRDSEAYFRLLFENSVVGFSQALPNGRLIRANRAYARMYGYSTPEEMLAEVTDIGRQLYADPGDRKRVHAILKEKGVMEPAEIQVRHRDGTPFVVLAGAREIRDAQGRLVCYQAEHVDITPLKQAEESLREMSEVFRLFLKHNPIYVFIKDENIRPIYLSENYEKMLKRPLAELLGRSMNELFPSELSRTMVEDDKKILRQGKPREFIEELDGRIYSTMKFPIFIQGKAKYLAGYTTDITERQKAQELLQTLSRRLQLALQSAQAGTWDWNVATGLIEWSPQMFELFGLDPRSSEASFASWRTALHPEDRELAENRIDQALKQHAPLDSDYRVILPGGQIRWINAEGVGVYDESGLPTQMIGICQDITERKLNEQQIRDSLREKEVLLKEIHHRVKNNLQVISGLLTLQAAQTNDERLQRMVKESQTRIWTMALIHQTLYQSGNLADIDMADLIRSLVGNLLSSHAQVAMPPTIRFDLFPLRLGIDKAIPLALIINELVTNAMKHAFADGRLGEIHILLQECRDAALHAPSATMDATPIAGTEYRVSTYELTITDNGVGLPAGFDLKNQKSLGLQLVAMLAQQLKCQLTIESSGGTAVHLLFTHNEKSKKQS